MKVYLAGLMGSVKLTIKCGGPGVGTRLAGDASRQTMHAAGRKVVQQHASALPVVS